MVVSCAAVPASVLADLAAEYPDVPGPALAQALESAYLAAHALGDTSDLGGSRVLVLARDRLDVRRQRALAAQRRAPFMAKGASSHLP